MLGDCLSGQVCEDQEGGRKWGCLRGVILLLERDKQLSIHISPKIPQEKKRGSKITSKTNEDKEARLAFVKESQSVHTAAWIQIGGTSRCHLMSLEAGAGSNTLQARVAGLRGRKFHKEEVLHRFPKLKASGPNAAH